jgi:acetolactate synthase-1/2/3 large subunit
VLIDIPKDVQQQMSVPYWGPKVSLNGYLSRLPSPPSHPQMERVLDMIKESKRPVVYAGGGCLDAAPELKEFIESTGIPVTNTLMGLGCYPASDELCLDMLGMHGAVYANYAVDSADLLLAFGVRFDDRVTGKLEAFAARASIVHIDIDPAEIGKNKEAHCPVLSNIKPALRTLNSIIRADKPTLDFAEWRASIAEQKVKFPFAYTQTDDYIVPQHAVELLCKMTEGKAIVSTGVGQHQMWAAQHYKFDEPRNWLTSGGLGSMGFGLPAAIGAAAARPDSVVVDIDGDGSFVMNIQELATLHAENLPVKMFVLNNQHLGMVVQWEDRFYGANRGHTYLGSPDQDYAVTKDEADIFPDFVKICEGFRVPAERVVRKSDLPAAIKRMLDHDGPYLLDVMFPHQEHVLPMVPGGGSFKDTITTGDGRTPETKDMKTL